ncbi:MAG: LDH2 family malate/lactate/ureidoglycolate dehydrogenase, partial [Roseivirga sp.]
MSNYAYSTLFEFSKSVFLAMGCPESDADQAATTLLSADLRGIDSHGVARLKGYVRLWEKGRINATPNIRVVHE